MTDAKTTGVVIAAMISITIVVMNTGMIAALKSLGMAANPSVVKSIRVIQTDGTIVRMCVPTVSMGPKQMVINKSGGTSITKRTESNVTTLLTTENGEGRMRRGGSGMPIIWRQTRSLLATQRHHARDRFQIRFRAHLRRQSHVVDEGIRLTSGVVLMTKPLQQLPQMCACLLTRMASLARRTVSQR